MPRWRNFFCWLGEKSAPDKRPGSISTPQSPKPRTASASAASLHSAAQSSSAWDLYDNTGSAQEAAANNQSTTAASSRSSSSSSQQRLPKIDSLNGLLSSRQAKSVRFDDQDSTASASARCPPTPDSFYDDLKNLDYALVPPQPAGRGAPSYDEIPPQSLLRPGAASNGRPTGSNGRQQQNPQQRDSDYALPPPQPPGASGDYDYAGGGAEASSGEYQNVGAVAATAAAAAAPANEPEVQPQPRPHPQQQQQQKHHRITREFLDDLLLSPSGSSSGGFGGGSSDFLDADKRSLISNTESIDSEDIGFRPDCQLRMQRPEAVQHLRQLETDFVEHCTRLYKFIHSRWKAEASLALNIDGIRPTLKELNALLDQLVTFYYGVLNNARLESCPDRGLSKKIWKHLRVFERNAVEFDDAVAGLERLDWSPKLIASCCTEQATDYLGFCVSSARDLQIQQRALSTAVHANSSLLFPTELPPQPPPPEQPQVQQEKVIPIETDEQNRPQSQQQQQQPQSDGSYMRMSLLTDSSGLSTGDQELLAVFRERLRNGSEVYAAMSQDLLASLESRQASGAVVGALCRNLASRAYKLNQMAIVLHEGLHSVQLRASLEQLVNQMSHLLKAILRTSKAIMETAPAEWQQQLAGQLGRYITDSLGLIRELNQLVASRVGV